MSDIETMLREVETGNESALSVVRALTDDGKKENITLALQNRELLPEKPREPEKARSPKRRHVIHNVKGFVEYLQVYGTESLVILADVPKLRCVAILDEKAETGFEGIELIPQIHPLFKPWYAAIQEEEMDLQSFLSLTMRNRRAITAPDGRALVMELSQVTSSTEVTVHRGKGANSLNGILFKTKIEGNKHIDGKAELPEMIRIEVPIFMDTLPLMMELDLLLRTDPKDHEIYVEIVCADLAEAMVKSWEEIIATCKQTIGKGLVAMGRAVHEKWDVVK